MDPSHPVVSEDGTIYIIGYYTLYSVNPNDGSFNWTFSGSIDNNEHYQLGWPALGSNGQVFVAHVESGVYARHIYAINSDNGNVIWKLNAGWGAGTLWLALMELCLPIGKKNCLNQHMLLLTLTMVQINLEF